MKTDPRLLDISSDNKKWDMKSLNLGCGNDYLEGYVNIDNSKIFKVDLIHDLNTKLPFKDKSIFQIISSHNLEHLDNWEFALKDYHRVLWDFGMLILKVPHGSISHFNPYHKHLFNKGLIDYYNTFNPNNQFIVKEFFYNMTREKRLSLLNFLFNPFINFNPFITERFISNWLGVEEMVFILRKKSW